MNTQSELDAISDEANASLIAAAPEMLEVLEMLVAKGISDISGSAFAEDVIAKAKGEVL